jgi:hypothetical protein
MNNEAFSLLPWEVISVQPGNGALGLAYYLGKRHAGIALRELARQVGEVEYPAVSLAIARFEKRLKTDRSFVGEEGKTGN